jgi:hypothetical protein
MIAFEVLVNGARVCTAGAGDTGVLSTIVSSVGKRQEIKLEVGGLSDDAQLKWPVPSTLRVGDEVTVRIVETDQPDQPASSQRDDPRLVETEERKYYERLKKKYEPK